MSVSNLRARGACLAEDNDISLTDVIPTALGAVAPSVPFARPDLARRLALPSADAVVVILVDGLGLLPLQDHLGHARTLRAFRDSIEAAYSVVPSTTAAGITACGTGQLPGQTRMVGYSVFHGEQIFNLLAFTDGIDPAHWQQCPTYFEKLRDLGIPSATILPAKFAGSGLTTAALRGAHFVPATRWEERCDAAVTELKQGSKLVYLYWSDIDACGHSYGTDSTQWGEALEDFDAGLGRFLSRIPSGVRVLLTADHGMVNIDFSQILDVAQTPALREGVRVVAGETRAVHVHCERGEDPERVRERWENFLDEQAWVAGPSELAELMGEGPGLAETGDFVAFSRGRAGIVDSRTQSAAAMSLSGVHGSLTQEEMLIPLIPLA